MTRLSSFLLLLFVLCFPFISFAYSLVAFVSFRFGYNVSSVAYNIITFSLKVLFLFYFYDTRSNMIFMAFFRLRLRSTSICVLFIYVTCDGIAFGLFVWFFVYVCF